MLLKGGGWLLRRPLGANRLATRIATTSEGHPHRPAGLLKVPGKVFDRPGEIQDGLANPRYRHTKIVEHLTSHRCIGDSYYVPCAHIRSYRSVADSERTRMVRELPVIRRLLLRHKLTRRCGR